MPTSPRRTRAFSTDPDDLGSTFPNRSTWLPPRGNGRQPDYAATSDCGTLVRASWIRPATRFPRLPLRITRRGTWKTHRGYDLVARSLRIYLMHRRRRRVLLPIVAAARRRESRVCEKPCYQSSAGGRRRERLSLPPRPKANFSTDFDRSHMSLIIAVAQSINP